MKHLNSSWLSLFGVFSLMILMVGCGRPTAEKFPTKEEKPKEKLEPVLGRKTQEVGEFQPGEQKESDLSVKAGSNPIAAYGGGATYAIAQSAKLGVTHALRMFNALEGRYPKDHEEFMEKIIKANGIQLPVLPGKRRYMYDVEKHELVIVDPEE